jgi:uncharacterized protein (UPF0276 family)
VSETGEQPQQRGAALPVLGVGLTYVPGLEALLEEEGDALDVVEVEPQTLWLRAPSEDSFRVDQVRFDYVRSLPGRKLLHGVGYPLGGYHTAEPEQVDMLQRMVEALDPAWISEHLAFNRATNGRGTFQTGFLLPPLQTAEGVTAAASSIRSLTGQIAVPLAVEHGVSYLQPRQGELSDGQFVRDVVEAADCGLVLDLHNAWTNARNGRQSLEHFLRDIPYDRVWEVHLAGGMEYQGYWLDAHSGEIPQPVLDCAREVIPRLPNLKALIFEIMPVYLETVGLPTVRAQLEKLRMLWELRSNAVAAPGVPMDFIGSEPGNPALTRCETPSPQEWENTLGALVVGEALDTPLARELASDPGLAVFQHLVGQFRASSVIGTLPFSGRLLLLTLGVQSFEALLSDYWQDNPPEAFGAEEARRFAKFLRTRALNIPLLDELVRFDLAAIAAIVESTASTVAFSQDPLAVLGALAERRLPSQASAGSYYADLSSKGIEFRAATAEHV